MGEPWAGRGAREGHEAAEAEGESNAMRSLRSGATAAGAATSARWASMSAQRASRRAAADGVAPPGVARARASGRRGLPRRRRRPEVVDSHATARGRRQRPQQGAQGGGRGANGRMRAASARVAAVAHGDAGRARPVQRGRKESRARPRRCVSGPAARASATQPRGLRAPMADPKTWRPPPGAAAAPPGGLALLNTLADAKTPFAPRSGGRRVTWYACGPTVYDSSHMVSGEGGGGGDGGRRARDGWPLRGCCSAGPALLE